MNPIKKQLRHQLAENHKALAGMCRLAGKPIPEQALVLPEKRTRKAVVKDSLTTDNSESAVAREIVAVLANHPRVLFAVRQNSGAIQGDRPIYFYQWARRNGVEMTLVDYWGLLTDGRMFAIEAKRRDWKKPKGDREVKQQAFIDVVISAGGLAGFATCGDDAKKILGESNVVIST